MGPLAVRGDGMVTTSTIISKSQRLPHCARIHTPAHAGHTHKYIQVSATERFVCMDVYICVACVCVCVSWMNGKEILRDPEAHASAGARE